MKKLSTLFIVIFGLAVLTPVLPSAEAGGLKVKINHKGKIINVSVAALPAHMAHGDTVVVVIPCPPNCD